MKHAPRTWAGFVFALLGVVACHLNSSGIGTNPKDAAHADGATGGLTGGGAGGAETGTGGRSSGDGGAGAQGGSGSEPESCGNTVCASGMTCCNASCGTCVTGGAGCTKQLCTSPTCSKDSDCKEVADYCTGCDCRSLFKDSALPACTGPGVRCLVDPCANRKARCSSGQCVLTVKD